MKDLGKLNHFIERDFHITQGCVKMNPNKYIGRVLERFNMSNCKPRATRCKLKMDLSNNSDPVDSRKYREIISRLIYLMTCTRPDLSYAVGKLSQYLSESRQQHWVAGKHILKYLRTALPEKWGVNDLSLQVGRLIRVIDITQQGFVFI